MAAGLSGRMGTGHQKLVKPYKGKLLIHHILAALVATKNIDEIIVITGHEHKSVEVACLKFDVTLIYNKNYAMGLSASIKAGIEAVELDCDGVLICHGDMPCISQSTLEALCLKFLQNPQRIIVPVFDNLQGNPVLWPNSFFSALKKLKGDMGAKHILKREMSNRYDVPFNKNVLFDIDTWADLYGSKLS